MWTVYCLCVDFIVLHDGDQRATSQIGIFLVRSRGFRLHFCNRVFLVLRCPPFLTHLMPLWEQGDNNYDVICVRGTRKTASVAHIIAICVVAPESAALAHFSMCCVIALYGVKSWTAHGWLAHALAVHCGQQTLLTWHLAFKMCGVHVCMCMCVSMPARSGYGYLLQNKH